SARRWRFPRWRRGPGGAGTAWPGAAGAPPRRDSSRRPVLRQFEEHVLQADLPRAELAQIQAGAGQCLGDPRGLLGREVYGQGIAISRGFDARSPQNVYGSIGVLDPNDERGG